MKLVRVLRETFVTSLPLAAVIIIVCVFVAPMKTSLDFIKLGVGYAGVVVGQSLFLVGLDISILPIGKAVGENLVKFKKLTFIVLFGLVFGLLSTAAEPALIVFARQTNLVMPVIQEQLFVWIMATGTGCFVGFALYRVVKDISLKKVFAIFYIVTFALVIFTPEEFIALAFDGSGATTGDISVPFMLALGMGVNITMSRYKTNDNTFGIIGLASVGPILAVFIYGIVMKVMHGGVLPEAGIYDPGRADNLVDVTVSNLSGIAIALVPIILVFLPFQLWTIKLPKVEFISILLGAIPVFFGLLIFLSSIDFGFAYAGKYIGEVFLDAARPEWFKWILLIIGFVLGAAITLSEPAVTVLGAQLEEITNGHIKRMTIRFTLAVGIGFAAVLSIVKILTQISILWFLAPLYILALLMMRRTPHLFVGLAFDSGGVSGGALTSAFLTPLSLGIAQAVAITAGAEAQSVLTNGFGIIAFISITPIISVQALGLMYEKQARKVEDLIDIEELEDLEELEKLISTPKENDSHESDEV